MRISSRIQRTYEEARVLPLTGKENFVFFSDCHRGYGGWNDNFAANQNVCFTALNYYYERGFTYVELGDGEELWENKKLRRIIETHSNIYWMLRRFYRDGRLIMLWGNHDNKKRNEKYVRKNYGVFWNECSRKKEELFPDLVVDEAVRLQCPCAPELFLLHGHQGDFLNDYLHPLAEFLVRYLWRPLERFGVRDPTRPAYNYRRCERGERRLREFAEKRRIIVICGHTHRPVFRAPVEGSYLNDGSMVHPRCITAIELSGGKLCLVKWSVCCRKDGTLFVCRTILDGPLALGDAGVEPE